MGLRHLLPVQILVILLIFNSNVCESQRSPRPLRVVSLLETPNLMRIPGTEADEKFSKNNAEGFTKDLIERLSNDLGFTYELHLANDHKYGSKRDQFGNWTGLVGELIDNKADIAIAQLTITAARADAVDFTTPFGEFELAIVIYSPNAEVDEDGDGEDDDEEEADEEEDDGQFVFLKPLTTGLWISFIIGIIVLILLIFLVEKYVGAKIQGDVREVGFFDGFCVKLLGPPKSIAARTLQVVFWVFIIIFASSYIANFAADRVMDSSRHETELPIKSFKDLLDQDDDFKVGVVTGGSTAQYLLNSKDEQLHELHELIKKHGTFLDSNERGIERVRNDKGKFAFIMEVPAARYATMRKPCELAVVSEYFGPKRGYGIATRKGSDWSVPINLAVMNLKETGVIDEIEEKWYDETSECPIKEEDDDFDIVHEHSPLTVVDMAGMFYFLLASLVLGVAFAFIEISLSTAKYK